MDGGQRRLAASGIEGEQHLHRGLICGRNGKHASGEPQIARVAAEQVAAERHSIAHDRVVAIDVDERGQRLDRRDGVANPIGSLLRRRAPRAPPRPNGSRACHSGRAPSPPASNPAPWASILNSDATGGSPNIGTIASWNEALATAAATTVSAITLAASRAEDGLPCAGASRRRPRARSEPSVAPSASNAVDALSSSRSSRACT